MTNNCHKIEYQKCFIAFLDILGFRKRVLESQDDSEMIGILLDSLSICSAFPSGAKKTVEHGEIRRSVSIQSRFFSDTVVFFAKEDPADLTQLLFMIRYLQDRLWEMAICLRGAITIGDMHWPDVASNKVTLGPGLRRCILS